MGQPRALVLLGQYAIKLGLELVTGRRYRVLPVEKRDGAFQLAAIIPKLERRQGVQRVPGRVDSSGFSGHGAVSSRI
jgi:hypothetical protein